MVVRRRGPRGAWALAAVFSVTFAACLFGPENADGPCGSEGCDDGNPCTVDTCAQDGFCDHTPSTDPPDDGNDCTDDACDGTAAVHTPKADGAVCGNGGMLQCDSGQCKCSSPAQCGESTTCVTYTCDQGTCNTDYAPARTLVDSAADGDCKRNECDGKGAVVPAPDLSDPPEDLAGDDCKKPACDAGGNVIEENDDTDIPGDIDSNPCTEDVCVNGAPTSDPAPLEGTLCGAPTCGAAGEGSFAETPAPVCTGGVCTTPAAIPCGLYDCNSAGTACRTSCGSSGDCTPSGYCSMTKCVPRIENGQACAYDIQCLSGACNNYDGICCDSECAFYCWSCRGDYNGGQPGLCKPITNNTDPYGDCSGSCSGGGNGCCNGNGSCY